MRKLVPILILLLAVTGCIQCSSFFDGATGVPMDEATKAGDLAGWYHFGHFMALGISDLIALIRIGLPLILPLLL